MLMWNLLLVMAFVSVLGVSAEAQVRSNRHVFPQIVDGRFSDGSYWQTTLVVTSMVGGGGQVAP